MLTTVVALMCHMLADIPQPVCREEIVTRAELSLMECQMASQIAVADWKEKSIYRGEAWHVAKITCKPGDYQPKEAI